MIRTYVLLALLALPLMLSAQPGRDVGERMAEELDLTDAQREQIRDIHASGGGRDEVREVLTPEQQAKADELHSKRAAHREKRVDHLKRELDLTPEQTQQIRDAFESGSGRDEIRAVLTEAQQAKFDEMRSERGGKGKGWRRPY